MSHRIAGIDVHKKMLAVVVADVEIEGEYQFERCRFATTPEHLRLLAEWLLAREVDEVVMESTAQPVLTDRTRSFLLALAECQMDNPTRKEFSQQLRFGVALRRDSWRSPHITQAALLF